MDGTSFEAVSNAVVLVEKELCNLNLLYLGSVYYLSIQRSRSDSQSNSKGGSRFVGDKVCR